MAVSPNLLIPKLVRTLSEHHWFYAENKMKTENLDMCEASQEFNFWSFVLSRNKNEPNSAFRITKFKNEILNTQKIYL